MIRTHRIIRAGLSLSLAFMAAASPAAAAETAETKALITGDFDLGGRAVSVSGSRDKFSEYRDVRNGFMVNDLRLRLENESKPYYMDLKIQNATRDDESYGIKSGVYGKWTFAASFDRTPHNFNTGTLILNGAGTNRLGIANAVQTNLQASEQTRADRGGVALTDTTGEDAAQQAIIRNLLSITDPTTFKLERERAAVSMGYNVTPDVKTWVKVSQERRDGVRSIAAGTYERFVQGGGGLAHTSDQFVATGLELAEPINYRTTTFNAGGGIYKKGWLVDAEYTLTDFDNGFRSFAWSNPFRTTDSGAKAADGVTNNNAFDRGRFVNGQMSLAPSNQSHDVSLSGSVELPMHSRFTGNVSYGMTNQNELLLPYTLNSGIAGINGAPANVTDAAALPVSRFNGEIRTITNSLALTTKPTEKLGASLKYRYYDYSNKSDSILFPGYAAFGESYWRTTRNDSGAAVRNDTPSYARQTAKLAVDYQIVHPLTVEVDAMWDRYNHKQQRIDSTDEVGAGAGFVYHPVEMAKLHGAYHYAHRAVKNYKRGATAANPEATGLANFNWADRIRNRADLRADVSPTEALSFGVAGQYQNDDYGAAERFGFKSQKNLIGSVDVTYDPSDKVSLSVNYSREHRKGLTQNGAKDDAFDAEITNAKTDKPDLKKSPMHVSLFVILAVFLALIFSGSRGVWLSAAGVVTVLGGMSASLNWKKCEGNSIFFVKRLTALFVLFGILFLPASLISSLTQRAQGGIADSLTGIKRVRSITDFEEVSNRSRLQIWKAALGTIAERPVFGVGPGNFSVALGEDIGASRKGASAHNLYLDIASEMGVPGLLLFLLLIGRILYRMLSSIFTVQNSESRAENLERSESSIQDSKFIIQKSMPMVFSVYFLWILGYSFFDVVLLNDKVCLFATILAACCYETAISRQPDPATAYVAIA